MLEIAIIFICFILNGILACSETAFVSVSRPLLRELEKKGNQQAKLLLHLRETPEKILSVIQVGITFVALLAGAFGGTGAIEAVFPWFISLGLPKTIAVIISNVLIVIPLTYLNVVFAELVPKTLALKNTLFFATATVRWLNASSKVLFPIVKALEWSTRKIVGLFRIKKGAEHPGEFLELGGLTKESKQYIFNIVKIELQTVSQIAIPWDDAIFVYKGQEVEEVEKIALSSGHTRLPVLENNHVVGILHTKEFFSFQKKGGGDWSSLIRSVIKFQENTPILTALLTMQEKQSHMAIIYKGDIQIGIVTLEDTLEQIVGEIYDEDDFLRLFSNRRNM